MHINLEILCIKILILKSSGAYLDEKKRNNISLNEKAAFWGSAEKQGAYAQSKGKYGTL